jgi:hypothetical protein
MRPAVVYTENAAGLGVQESEWVYLDAFCDGPVSVQVNCYGPVTYSVFSTLDDPTSPDSPVPVPYVTWFACHSAFMVNSNTPGQTYYASAPRFIKLVQTGGAGIAQMTVVQGGVVPQ